MAARRVPHRGDEVLLAVVDGEARPERQAPVGAVATARGHRDVRPQRRTELDAHRPDAARAAVHEQPLAGRQAAHVDHVAPDGAHRLGEGGRVHEVDPLGDGEHLRRAHPHLLRVPAAVEQRDHPVADRPARHRVPDAGHRARDLQARPVGCAGRGRGGSSAL
ncbi:Uncharacterised protein [Mycobacteroides abscessus]|nr:Uncharacterised protein [Mycobacteroides abscessus]